MIDFYTWKTPNCNKVAIMLEEVELPYQVYPVDLTKQKQFQSEFLKINPNNKVPAIVDHEGTGHRAVTIFESGAILFYLAEKTDKLFATNLQKRSNIMQWLMFQMSGLGPMCGQMHYFLYFTAERIPYAIERYSNEIKHLYHVMDGHLEREMYFAGDYSIADIAIFPWVHLHERHRIDLDEYANLKRWHDRLAERPAVQKGLQAMYALAE